MGNWLESIKPNQPVIIASRHSKTIGNVERLTPTQVIVMICQNRYRFNRLSGHEVGNQKWDGSWLIEGTVEAVLEVRKNTLRTKLARELNHRNWENVPLEQLEQIKAIVSKQP